MKKIYAVLALFSMFNSVSAYWFSTKMKGEIIESQRKALLGTLKLKITEHLAPAADAFPLGTVFDLRIVGNQGASLYTNPKMQTIISNITLPDGSTIEAGGKEMTLKTLSSTKSFFIPFYRISKLSGNKEKRAIKDGSVFNISKAKAGAKNITAILQIRKI